MFADAEEIKRSKKNTEKNIPLFVLFNGHNILIKVLNVFYLIVNTLNKIIKTSL
jgi:hypothetical protein